MKRDIDLFANLSKQSYTAGVTINGRRFVGESNLEHGSGKVSRELCAQVEAVYGSRLIEQYWEYRDIHAYLNAAIDIAKDLDKLLRMEAGNEQSTAQAEAEKA